MKKGAPPKAPPPERQYSLQEAVMISRWVTQCLDNHPEWFESQGVFRLSGRKNEIDSIIKAILEKQNITINPHFRDEYIGVLKDVLRNSLLVSKDDPDVVALRSAIEDKSTEDEVKSKALKTFIQNCTNSADPNKVLLAEILHNYLHVLKLAEKQKATNSMHANNLAIIITPIIIDKIFQITDLSVALNLNDPVKNISAPLIAGNDYLGCFKLDERIEQLTKEYTGLVAGKVAVERALSSLDIQRDQNARTLQELEARKSEMGKAQYQAEKKKLDQKISELGSAIEKQTKLLSELDPLVLNRRTTLQSLKRQKNEVLEARGEATTTLSSSIEILPRTSRPIARKEERPEFFEGLNEPVSPAGISPVGSPPTLSPPSSPSAISPVSTPPDSVSSSPQRSHEGSPEGSPRRRGRTPPILLSASVSPSKPTPAQIKEDFQVALAAAKEGKPTKVIENLVESLKVLNLSPQDIGKLLYEHRAELSEYKEQLGDILSQPPKDKSTKEVIVEYKYKSNPEEYIRKIAESDEFKMLEGYMGQFKFKDMDFGPALKEFLEQGGFRLPGEAQKVNRIMEAFGNCYYKDNKEKFPDKPSDETKGADKIQLLAVTTIMLNTDLHNPSVKKKMTKDVFIDRVKICGIDDKKYAEQLYNYIKKNEIAMPKAGEEEPRAAATPLKKR